MTFKTVNGLGREHYAKKAFETAMANFANPSFVDTWLDWFDKHPGDNINGQHTSAVATPVEKLTGEMVRELESAKQCGICEQCVPQVGGGSGCRNCSEGHAVMCADDCPTPEYHAGDLEEVAALQTQRVKRAVIGIMEQMRDILPAQCYRLIDTTLNELEGELRTPGYVEALLPE